MTNYKTSNLTQCRKTNRWITKREKGKKLQKAEKVKNYKKPKNVEQYGTVWEKSAEDFLHWESKMWGKIPLGFFLLVNSVEKSKNVKNYKKLEKNQSIKLFIYKVRGIC